MVPGGGDTDRSHVSARVREVGRGVRGRSGP